MTGKLITNIEFHIAKFLPKLHRNLKELWKTGTIWPRYAVSKIRSLPIELSKLRLTDDNHVTYVAHDLAVRNLTSTEINNSGVKLMTPRENVNIIDGIQIVNYSQPKDISLYD